MNSKADIFLFDCFTTQNPNSGNRAAVLINAQLTASEQQSLATKLNLPVTVFIQEQTDTSLFEFFYPEKSMPLCIHGTLAGASLLLQRQPQTKLLKVQTQSQLTLSIKAESELIQVLLTPQACKTYIPKPQELISLLNLDDPNLIDTNLFLGTASVGSPKLLIPLQHRTTLENLAPNFEAIKQWSQAQGINGLYVYTEDTQKPEYNILARAFNPITGHNEDIATGTAAGALASVLKHDLCIEQGRNVGHPSLIQVYYENEAAIWVGGRTKSLGKQ